VNEGWGQLQSRVEEVPQGILSIASHPREGVGPVGTCADENGGSEMNEAVWKKEDGVGAQMTPTWAIYPEAMNRFTKSATAFMEHVHLLTEAREAYEEAMTASAALRNSLDSGDQTLRSLRAQLARVVNDHLDEPTFDRKKPELLKSSGSGKAFP
jgi:hypothetical protein